MRRYLILACFTLLFTSMLLAEDAKPDAELKAIEFKFSGLFSEFREDDLRYVFEDDVSVRVKDISFQDATATLVFDPAKIKLADLIARLKPSGFGIVRQFAVITTEELDCKACAAAIYKKVMQIDGVDQAAASIRRSRVSVWFDPFKTSREAIETVIRTAKGHGSK
ncbi:MAG: heavy metal-associated domain-containing protein [Planctomycetota bacterium]